MRMRVEFPRHKPRVAAVSLLALLAAGCSSTQRFAENPFSNPFKAEPSATGSLTPAPTASVARQPLAPRPERVSNAPVYNAPAPTRTAIPEPTTGGAAGWTAQGGSLITIVQGDTLQGLSTRYGVPPAALMAANGLKSAAEVKPGSRIVIPVYSTGGSSRVAHGNGAAVPAAAHPAGGLPKVHVVETPRPIVQRQEIHGTGKAEEEIKAPKEVKPAKEAKTPRDSKPTHKDAKVALKDAKTTQSDHKLIAHEPKPSPKDLKAKEAKAKEAAAKEAAAKEAKETAAKGAKAKEAAAREAAAREVKAKEAAAKQAKVQEAKVQEMRAKEAKAKEAQAREAKAKEAQAKEVAAREAKAREAKAREAKAREAKAREAKAKEMKLAAKDTHPGSSNGKTASKSVLVVEAKTAPAEAKPLKTTLAAAPLPALVPQPKAAEKAPDKVAAALAEPQETASIATQDKSDGAGFRWPARGRVIAGFGAKGGNEGINIAVPEGTPVKAAEGGTVAYAGSELKGYGNLILVRHEDGWVSAYANNGEMLVKRGEKVKRGQTIAKSGQTGNVASPQLHFELRKGATPVDPMPHLAGG